MTDDIFADGIDGVHLLRRRRRTRLWFRALPPLEEEIPEHLRLAIEHAPHLAVTAPDLVEAVKIHPVAVRTEAAQTDLLIDLLPDVQATTDLLIDQGPAISPAERQTRMLRRLGQSPHLHIAPVPEESARFEMPEPLTDWRTVPTHAPTLLLSSSKLLDGRRPGPILGPGRKYRIFLAAEGVVGMEVIDVDGTTAPGFCNAVDLLCIEPMVVTLAGGSKKEITKQRLQRLSKGINQVTGSLTSLMS
jgi:hypothetical protein